MSLLKVKHILITVMNRLAKFKRLLVLCIYECYAMVQCLSITAIADPPDDLVAPGHPDAEQIKEDWIKKQEELAEIERWEKVLEESYGVYYRIFTKSDLKKARMLRTDCADNHIITIILILLISLSFFLIKLPF